MLYRRASRNAGIPTIQQLASEQIWFMETHIKKNQKKAFFLIWDLDIVQPNDTGHTAKQHLQGACKQGRSGISPSWMKVDSADCSSPPQSSALPGQLELTWSLHFF